MRVWAYFLTPKFQFWFNIILAIVWFGLTFPIVIWLSHSIPILVFISVYAIVTGHLSAAVAAISARFVDSNDTYGE